jgi:ATP-binding cassette, subfamily C (CFTR/MRP), member 1
LIVFYTDLETSLGAVARIKEYVEDIKSEDLPREMNEPPHDWPSKGAITFEDVSASYS